MFLFLAAGCAKDKTSFLFNQFCLTQSPYCTDYTPPQPLTFQTSGSLLGFTDIPFPHVKAGYIDPCFNPNNPNQFCFGYGTVDNPGSRITTFDMCTGQMETIVNSMSFMPQWGKTGWILFYDLSGQTWKIKANGDSLTKLTFTPPYNTGAVWNDDGTMFIYSSDYSLAELIADANGNVIDSVNFRIFTDIDGWKTSSLRWHKDMIAFIGSHYANNMFGADLIIYSLTTKSFTKIASQSSYWAGRVLSSCSFSQLDWLNDKEIVITDRARVYKINIDTKQIDTLLTGADNFNFSTVTTANGRYLLFDLQKYAQEVSRDTLYYASELTVWDMETKKFKTITPP